MPSASASTYLIAGGPNRTDHFALSTLQDRVGINVANSFPSCSQPAMRLNLLIKRVPG